MRSRSLGQAPQKAESRLERHSNFDRRRTSEHCICFPKQRRRYDGKLEPGWPSTGSGNAVWTGAGRHCPDMLAGAKTDDLGANALSIGLFATPDLQRVRAGLCSGLRLVVAAPVLGGNHGPKAVRVGAGLADRRVVVAKAKVRAGGGAHFEERALGARGVLDLEGACHDGFPCLTRATTPVQQPYRMRRQEVQ